MITRLVMIDGIEHTIIAPVVNSVVKDLQDHIFKDKDAKLYIGSFYEEEDVDVNDHVTTNEIGKSKLFVNFEYEDNEELSYNPSIYKAKDKIILRDKQTGFSLRPISTSTDLTMTFTYKNKSKIAVQKVLNKIKNFYKFTGYSLSHRLSYSYLLPKVLMSLMSEIATLKGDANVFNFIEQAAIVKFDYAVKRGSDFKVPSFRGVEAGIIGNIQDEADKLKIGKDGQLYTIEFTYLLTFDKPTTLAVHYPITVNNKPINEKWLPKEELAAGRDRATGQFDISRILRDKFHNGVIQSDIMIRVPNFDQFTPFGIGRYHDRIKLLSILLQLDTDEPNTLLDINDLIYVGLPKNIVDYLLAAGDVDLFNFGHSLFHIELFENNYIKNKKLEKTSDGKIVATEPLDTTKTYHLLFNVVTNKRYLAYVKPKGNDRLAKDIELMKSMNIIFKDDTFALVQNGNNITGY